MKEQDPPRARDRFWDKSPVDGVWPPNALAQFKREGITKYPPVPSIGMRLEGYGRITDIEWPPNDAIDLILTFDETDKNGQPKRKKLLVCPDFSGTATAWSDFSSHIIK
jgi:hypothetical protein